MLSDFMGDVSLNPWPYKKRERTLQNLFCMNVSLVCIYYLYAGISSGIFLFMQISLEVKLPGRSTKNESPVKLLKKPIVLQIG